MPWLKTAEGIDVHVKVQRPRRHRCKFCGAHGATKQCDGPSGNGSPHATCNAWMCVSCAQHHAPDTDYCPNHRK